MSAIPLSFVIGSPIAGWILGHAWLGLAGWRWLFFLEGMPAILLGAVAFSLLTDWPGEAAWLAPAGRQWIEQKLQAEKPAGAQTITAWQAFKSPAVMFLASITFLNYFSYYAFLFWFPTILQRQSGLSDFRVGMLGAVPYAVAFVLMQVNGWHSDKARERRWHSALPMFIGASGLLGLSGLPRSLGISMVFFTMVGMMMAYLPTFWAIPTEILSQSAAAVAVGMINAVGSIAGFAGPYLFGLLNTYTGSFSYGLALITVIAYAGGLGILCIPRRSHAHAG